MSLDFHGFALDLLVSSLSVCKNPFGSSHMGIFDSHFSYASHVFGCCLFAGIFDDAHSVVDVLIQSGSIRPGLFLIAILLFREQSVGGERGLTVLSST